MTQEKLKVLFYLKKSKTKQKQPCPIMGRIRLGRNMCQFSSKLACPEELWDSRSSRLLGKSKLAVEVNAKLDQLHLSIQKCYEQLLSTGKDVNAQDVKTLFQGQVFGRKTFLQAFDDLISSLEEQIGTQLKESSFKSYLITRKHLALFIQKVYKTDDLVFSQIHSDFLDQLKDYIIVDKGLSLGYYRAISLKAKKVLTIAYQKGDMEQLLFANIKLERGDEKAPRSLDAQSLEKIRTLSFHDLEVQERYIRDVFLFACYTGIAFCDLFQLNVEHLVKDDNQDYWLKFHRQKTGQLSRIKLIPQALEILNCYQKQGEKFLLQAVSYSHYSLVLRVISERVGLSFPLTSHIARHTFATLITLEQGVSIETVSKMLGHSDISTTERYAQVTAPKLFNEFKLFLDYTSGLSLKL